MASEGDAERLVVLLEARIRDFEKNMQKASGTADKAYGQMRRGSLSATRQMEQDMLRSTARINQALATTSARVGAFGKGIAAGFAAGISITAAEKLIDSATRIKNALKVAGLSGEELTRVYERLFESAQRNGAPIEALVTLYGRAAQQQKELGVSTEQLLQFTDNVSVALRVVGTDATQASGALLQLGQALGSGTVHAEEFNSILEGVPTIAQAAALGIKEANGSVAALKQLVVDGKLSSKAFFDGFSAGAETLAERARSSESTISSGFVRLQNVLVDVATRFDDSTHASRILANMINDRLIPAVTELGGIFTGVTNGPIGQFYDWIGKAIDRVVQLSADIGALTGLDEVGRKFGGTPYIGAGRIQDRIDGAFAGTAAPKGDRAGVELTVTKPAAVVKPSTLADYPVSGAKKAGGTKAIKKTADDRFAEDVQDIRDRTAALKAERESLGLSYREQERRKIALDLETEALKDVREAARRKGDTDWQNVQLSDKQRATIDEVSAAYAAQADALRQASEMMELRRDVLKGVFGDIRSALDDGKITAEEWGNVFMGAIDKVINKIEDELVDALAQLGGLGGSAGGGGLLGGILSLLGFAKGGVFEAGRVTPFAQGGVVSKPTVFPMANGAGLMGEAGPEAIMPLRRTSDGRLGVSAGRSGGEQKVQLDIRVAMDQNGNLQTFVEKTSAKTAGVVVNHARGQLAEDSANFVRHRSRSNPGFFR